jgi:hypothetical protein
VGAQTTLTRSIGIDSVLNRILQVFDKESNPITLSPRRKIGHMLIKI